jgi:hypothetical protein
MSKMEPCCARLQATLAREEAALRQTARQAERQRGYGRDTTKYVKQIADLKVQIAKTKQLVVDHDAEHCVDVPCVDPTHFELRA